MYLQNLNEIKKFENIIIIEEFNQRVEQKLIEEKNYLIIIRQNKIDQFLIEKLKKKKINFLIFSWQFFNKNNYIYFKSHRDSFSKMNDVYQSLINNHKTQIKLIQKIYNSDIIYEALKKYCIDVYQDYLDLENIKNLLKKYNSSTNLVLTSKKNISIFKLIKSKNINLIENKEYKLLNYLKIFFYPIIFFLNKKIKIKINRKKYKFALRIYSNGFLFNSFGNLDWLIKRNKIISSEVIFVLEDDLEKNNKLKFQNLLDSKYVFANSNLRKNSYIEFSSILKNIKLFFQLFFCNIDLFSKDNDIFFNFYDSSIKNYLIWKNFLDNYKFDYYFVYHNYQIDHYFRNILLNADNCKTVHLKATNSEIIFNYALSKDYNNSKMAMFFYDYEFHQTYQSAEMSYKNNSISKNITISGPTFIADRDNINNPKSFLGKKKFKILLFNSSYNSYTSVNNFNSHYLFLLFIKKLLLKNEYELILKSKKAFEEYLQIDNKISNLAKEILEEKNLKIITNNVSNNVLIDESDLSVSMPFTSPIIYSIFKKKPFIYTDFDNQYYNSFFSKYKKFYAFNHDQAFRLIDIDTKNKEYKNEMNQIYYDCFRTHNLQNSEDIIFSKINSKYNICS